MAELNKANRQVCDVDIRILKTMAPFLFFDTANTTTVGVTGDSVYAMAKGSKRIAFQNPIEATLTIECQVYPFKLFSLFSDGAVDTSAAYAAHETITCDTAGTLSISVSNGEINEGTVFVYPSGSYGDEDELISGTFADGTFTAENADDIAVDTDYEVGYLVTREGVKKVSFTNKTTPPDYFITMLTADKDEEGTWTPFVITAYKASIQRNFELSFSSEGDPATVSLTSKIISGVRI